MWPPAEMPYALRELLWPGKRRIQPAPIIHTTKARAYVQAALEREVEAVATSAEGARNDTLNRSAYALARFVQSGQLEASAFVDALTAAASRTGLPETEIRRTLASALQGRS
jgi:hypothetical protein